MKEQTVEGLKDLEKALLKLDKAVRKDVLKKSMMKASKPLVDDMKRRARVAPAPHQVRRKTIMPGTLHRSIRRKTLKTDGVLQYEHTQEVGPRGRNAYAARWVEFGTAPHYISKYSRRRNHRKVVINRAGRTGAKRESRKMHPGAKPYPFIRPAWNLGRDKVLRDFRINLLKNIERAAKS